MTEAARIAIAEARAAEDAAKAYRERLERELAGSSVDAPRPAGQTRARRPTQPLAPTAEEKAKVTSLSQAKVERSARAKGVV